MKPWQRWTLGILCIGGGVVGVTLVAIAAIAAIFAKFEIRTLLIVLIPLAFFGFGIWLGVGFIKEWKVVLLPAKIFWAIQVPVLQLPFFTYFLTCGPYGIFTVTRETGWHFNLLLDASSQFQFSPADTEQPLMLGVNYFALFVAIFLPSSFSPAADLEQGSQNGK